MANERNPEGPSSPFGAACVVAVCPASEAAAAAAGAAGLDAAAAIDDKKASAAAEFDEEEEEEVGAGAGAGAVRAGDEGSDDGFGVAGNMCVCVRDTLTRSQQKKGIKKKEWQ